MDTEIECEKKRGNIMKKVVDIIVVGFAIFSMFFGAGNLIFPPYIGMASGSGWLISYLGFIISDVGMILLSIIAIAKAGSYQAVLGRAGKKFGLGPDDLVTCCHGQILIPFPNRRLMKDFLTRCCNSYWYNIRANVWW